MKRQSFVRNLLPEFSTYGNAPRLTNTFYNQGCHELAKQLLGKVIVRKLPGGQILRGTIVETEAYPGGKDAASKSFNGNRTEGNEPMYMDPGTAYVYFTYGMYHCFNISSKGEGSAVLIRGIEPKEEYETMHQLRRKKPKLSQFDDTSTKSSRKKVAEQSKPEPMKKRLKIHELSNGPGKLCMAFDIRKANCNKLNMVTSDELWLEENEDSQYHVGNFTIEAGKRIGIDSTPPEARDQLWRFFIADNFSVSKVNIAQVRKNLAQKAQGQEANT